MSIHSDGMVAEDFYIEPHRHLFEALADVWARGTLVDLVTVGEELRKKGRLEAIGGPVFLANLLDEVATTAGVEYYVRIVKEKSQIRRMITAATEIATAGYAPDVEVADFMNDAESKVFSVLKGQDGNATRHMREVLVETMRLLREQAESGATMSGIPSGFDQLDKITMGLQRSDLIIVAARPGMGKTSFALSVASNVAIRSGKAVVLFSLEMGAEQLAMRLLSSEAHVNLKVLRGGRPHPDDFNAMVEAAGRLSEANIYLDDTPAIKLADIRARTRRLALRGQCDVIILDYLQLMGVRSGVPREQQISEVSRGLKALAKELNVPVIALSQLNRALEKREDKRPMLSDLRESGAIEQDADIIMFVYRHEYYFPDAEDQRGVAEIIVGKQRNGPTDTARVAFIGQYTKFGNLAPVSDFQ